ncbi:hypothetical protein [Ornithinimicrobium kibberense]|uniref:hypothetical protein n=1 Tax=Ornithinimicrobium kibberense TaxID=282060 RepID=UPI00361E06DA
MAGDDALVGLGTDAEVLAVDRPDVRPADARGPHPQQHLARPGLGHGDGDVLDGGAARQPDAAHRGGQGHRGSLRSAGGSST